MGQMRAAHESRCLPEPLTPLQARRLSAVDHVHHTIQDTQANIDKGNFFQREWQVNGQAESVIFTMDQPFVDRLKQSEAEKYEELAQDPRTKAQADLLLAQTRQ